MRRRLLLLLLPLVSVLVAAGPASRASADTSDRPIACVYSYTVNIGYCQYWTLS